MTAAEQAVVTALTAEGKAAVQALLLDIADKEIPALIQAELAKLPVAYGPMAGAAFSALYPSIDAMIDAKIAALLP